jgi:hypothetical protein
MLALELERRDKKEEGVKVNLQNYPAKKTRKNKNHKQC